MLSASNKNTPAAEPATTASTEFHFKRKPRSLISSNGVLAALKVKQHGYDG
jgi:hypothetical protein